MNRSSHVGQLVDAEVRMVDPFELVPHKWRYHHEGDSAPSLPRQLLHILHVTYLALHLCRTSPKVFVDGRVLVHLLHQAERERQ